MKRGDFGYLLLVCSLFLFLLSFMMITSSSKLSLISSQISSPVRQPSAAMITGRIASEDYSVVTIASKEAFVDITENRFEPDELIVEPDTVITWRSRWSIHVIDVYTMEGKYQSIAMSKKLGENSNFSFAFNKTGEYFFRDIYFGWKGRILVE